jgi:phosphate starvation-inducible protein PhoH and related proteins
LDRLYTRVSTWVIFSEETLSRKKRRDNFETDYFSEQNLSKKKRRDNLETNYVQNNFKGMGIKNIEPLTENQKKFFDSYHAGKHILCHGVAGTGKSFISLYAALDELMRNNINKRTNIVIIRSAVQVRDIGHLPGTLSEKVGIYELPMRAICSELYGRGDAYDLLKNKEIITFYCTSFIRGLSFNDSIVLVDEIQNMTAGELFSVMTRIGKNTRVIFCGDLSQADLRRDDERQGAEVFMDVIDKMEDFAIIDFEEEDIVRSGIVKKFLIKVYEMGFDEYL